MTTETTNTEVTTTEEAPKSKFQLAEEFVKENNFADVVQRIVDLQVKAEVAIEGNQRILNERDTYRKELYNWKNSITEFIKERITEDSVDVDDLKELAEELDIELTKTVEISFTVTYTAEAIVPLDFDTDNIDETDFDVSVRYNGNSDYDVEETNCDIEDFDISDNN